MNRSCPVCGSYKKKCMYRQKFMAGEINFLKKYDVVVCNQCGVIFADKLPGQADFDKYYATSSKYEKKEIQLIDSFSCNPVYYDTFYKLKKHINKNSYIADIGCGAGDLLRIFKDNGFNNIKGFDPSQQCVDYIQCAHNIPAEKADITHIGIYEKVDCIILHTVLEHLLDLDTILNKMYDLLNDEGYIYYSA